MPTEDQNELDQKQEKDPETQQPGATRTKKENQTVAQKILFVVNIVIRVFQSVFVFGVVLLLLGGSLAAGIGAGYFAYLVEDTATPTKEQLQKDLGDITETSKMVYADGSDIATIRSDLMRTKVASDQISDWIKLAIINTEDENFEEHNGVVPKAVIRALISDATGFGGGSGGSTLTQQLVKQQVLTDEVSFKRKANEILLAMQVEKFFTKDEIVTTYLNVSPFGRNNKGQNIAGVQEAAQGIFGVDAKDVNLAQAAFIAGLPQSPISYSPYTNTGDLKEDYSAGLERKDFVLFSMYRNKAITKQEYEDAIAYDLAADFKKRENVEEGDQGFLYTTVLEEATAVLAKQNAEEAGLSEDEYQDEAVMTKYTERARKEIQDSGYTIHSTIDKTIYNAMQQAVADNGWILDQSGDYTAPVETGTVLMENSTGKVLGFIGSRDYSTNQNNHAFDTERQSGSSIKPILVYGPAIDQGLAGSESMISNYERTYTGGTKFDNATTVDRNTFVSLRSAQAWSHNYTAVNTYDYLRDNLGSSFVYENYLQKMNYTNENGQWEFESAPLGTVEVTTLNQTNAFQALANGGTYQEGYVVESITNNEGDVIYQHEADPVQVYSASAASIMNDLMRTVIDSGYTTDFKSVLSGINGDLTNADWVGKTGTTDDNTDTWLVMSTPTVTIGTWTGRDDSQALGYAAPNVASYVALLVNQINASNSEVFGVGQKFELTSDVQQVTVSNITGTKSGSFTYQSSTLKDPGKNVTSLWASGATVPSTSFKFGIGGSDANYTSFWSKYITKTSSSSSSSSSSNSNNSSNSNSNNSTNNDKDEEDDKDEDDDTTNNNNTNSNNTNNNTNNNNDDDAGTITNGGD